MENLTFSQRFGLVLIPALLTVCAALGAALITARFSINKFYKERLWEKKLDAYELLLKKLAESLEWLEDANKLATGRKEFANDQAYEKWLNDMDDLDRQISRMVSIGPFVISEQASEKLMRYAGMLQANFDRPLHISREQDKESIARIMQAAHKEMTQLLSDLRDCAKVDLYPEPWNRRLLHWLKESFGPFE